MEILQSMIQDFIEKPTKEKFAQIIISENLRVIIELLIYKKKVDLFYKYCKTFDDWDKIYSHSSGWLQKFALEKMVVLYHPNLRPVLVA